MPKNTTKQQANDKATLADQVAVDTYSSQQKVRVYDFAHPDRLSRTNLRALQKIFGSLERPWGQTLSTVLRSEAEVLVSSVAQVSFGQQLETMPSDSLLSEITLDPLPGGGFIYVPLTMALGIVDCMTGGDGSGANVTRALTQIEQGILKRALQRLTVDLQAAWHQVIALDVKVGSVHESLDTVELDRSELVVGANYTCSVGQATYTFGVIMPVNSLSSVLEGLDPKKWMEQGITPAPSVSDALMTVTLPITVQLGKASVNIQDLLNMEVGDVIRLDSGVNDLIEVKVGGRNMFRAVPGLRGRRLAVRIVERVDDESDFEDANDTRVA
jgi:flagellar motor switch protein FliM